DNRLAVASMAWLFDSPFCHVAIDDLVHRLHGAQHLRRDFAAAYGKHSIEKAQLDKYRSLVPVCVNRRISSSTTCTVLIAPETIFSKPEPGTRMTENGDDQWQLIEIYGALDRQTILQNKPVNSPN